MEYIYYLEPVAMFGMFQYQSARSGADSKPLVTALLVILLPLYFTAILAFLLLGRKYLEKSRATRELMSILYIK